MGRRRKLPNVDDEKENENEDRCTLPHKGPMFIIMSNVQLNETFHKRYIKEMKQLYAKMDHDAFIFTFVKIVKIVMEAEEANEYANNTLMFCARFISSFDCEDTHSVMTDTCKWLLSTISNSPHIRFRLCQFVNMILKSLGVEAALDDGICDRILEYMLDRLRDISPSVRVQAIMAMQRLQVPDNPDDPVLRAYQYHLSSDPSPRVRQTVITSMGRNYHTLPYILDRLWDIDEKVRRHTYLHMSSYPVRSYRVSQRLMLLEQGLNDRSEAVQKVVCNVMLHQWVESFQKDFVSLISALKLDSTETEIDRFRKVTKQTLKRVFTKYDKVELMQCLPYDEDGEFYRCIPVEKLTIELSIYWQCLCEFFQSENLDELDLILPELSKFCSYIERFCEEKKNLKDKFEEMEFQYKLLSLMEIIYAYDMGDETGRNNLKNLLEHLLRNVQIDEKVIEISVKCVENLIIDPEARFQYFIDIIRDMCDLNSKQSDIINDRNLISELLPRSSDTDLNLILSSLKVKILDLEEQEMELRERKEFLKATHVEEEKNSTIEEYRNLVKPLLSDNLDIDTILPRIIKNETILKCLQMIFYMVVSTKISSLNPNTCRLYNDFISRHICSSQIIIRDWALKCSTAYSLLYEPLAKEVFEELYAQFFRNHTLRLWETAISCIFDLLHRYGIEYFTVKDSQNKSKHKNSRQLYNTLEYIDAEEDANSSSNAQSFGVIYAMSHLIDTCEDVCIANAIITGFCRLLIHGVLENTDIIEKLLLRYFNPTTEPQLNQILGVFLECLIQRKKQHLLKVCLLPTVSSVLSASYDNPLHEIRPDTITRFIIDATRQEKCANMTSNATIHEEFAKSFLQEMLSNVNNKEMCKLLSKELLTLDLDNMQNEQLKNGLKELADKIIVSELDPKTVKNIISFKDLVDGKMKPFRPIVDNEEHNTDDEIIDECSQASKETDAERTLNAANQTSSATTTSLVEENDRTLEKTLTHQSLISEKEKVKTTPLTNQVSDFEKSPTMFGRDNNIVHRSLRKSLNVSRANKSNNIDRPLRPSKIRIEARIDTPIKAIKSLQADHICSPIVQLPVHNDNIRSTPKTQHNKSKQSIEFSSEEELRESAKQQQVNVENDKCTKNRRGRQRKASEEELSDFISHKHQNLESDEYFDKSRDTPKRTAEFSSEDLGEFVEHKQENVESDKGGKRRGRPRKTEDYVTGVNESPRKTRRITVETTKPSSTTRAGCNKSKTYLANEMNDSDIIPPSPTNSVNYQSSRLLRQSSILAGTFTETINAESSRLTRSKDPSIANKTSLLMPQTKKPSKSTSNEDMLDRNNRKHSIDQTESIPVSPRSPLRKLRNRKIDKKQLASNIKSYSDHETTTSSRKNIEPHLSIKVPQNQHTTFMLNKGKAPSTPITANKRKQYKKRTRSDIQDPSTDSLTKNVESIPHIRQVVANSHQSNTIKNVDEIHSSSSEYHSPARKKVAIENKDRIKGRIAAKETVAARTRHSNLANRRPKRIAAMRAP